LLREIAIITMSFYNILPWP